MLFYFFFFSSRRRHTRLQGDWSSDVCSSDLSGGARTQAAVEMTRPVLTQIGKYPVLRKLGEGGTSEVYLCNDPFNARDVAIKVAFPEQFHDPDRGRRYKKLFLTEASLAGKLHHPHICKIYDAVAEEKLNYIVMEYVDGGTLD